MAYRRFRHFYLDRVTMDFAFFAIAFNIKKMCTKMAKRRPAADKAPTKSPKTSINHVFTFYNRIENSLALKMAA
jgi:hypothetical protein